MNEEKKNEKDLKRYSYGIHIEKLTVEESKKILKEYYGIKYLPKIPDLLDESHANKTSRIKGIYGWALHILLLNGYRMPLFGFGGESLNPFLYYQDMLMLLYFYMVNKKEALSANQLPLAPSTNTSLSYIEKSGFGNILGIRRENKKIRQNNIGKNSNKRKWYVRTISKEKMPQTEKSLLESILSGQCTCKVVEMETKNKYNIPNACQDIVTSLIKSRKYNPFILFAEKGETLSAKELQQIKDFVEGDRKIKTIDDVKFFTDTYIDLLLPIFTKEIQDNLLLLSITGGKIQKKMCQYHFSSIDDIDIEKEFKFYKKYFRELRNVEELQEPGEREAEKQEKKYRELANRYLSESIFGYLYYERILTSLSGKLCTQKKESKEFSYFMEAIYQVSESPLCFSREGHIRQYWETIFSEMILGDMHSEKELWRAENQISRNEQYTVNKFLPALFYCFLYYMEGTGIMKARYSPDNVHSFMRCFEKDIRDFEELDKRSFYKWLSSPSARILWLERKKEYLKPLVYEEKKALF